MPIQSLITLDSLYCDNRPYARPGHMVQNHTFWDANGTVGLPKHRQVKLDWYELLCFGSTSIQPAH